MSNNELVNLALTLLLAVFVLIYIGFEILLIALTG